VAIAALPLRPSPLVMATSSTSTLAMTAPPVPPVMAAQDARALSDSVSQLGSRSRSPAATERPPAAVERPRAGGQPQLVLGPGATTTVLMQPSPNPASAGTYPLNRQFSVGDEAIYEGVEALLRGEPTIARRRVTRVDEDADIVEFNNGARITDTMGNTLFNDNQTSEPRQQLVPAELQLGRKWRTRYHTAGNRAESEVYYDFAVVSREWIDVPAGRFEAFKIEGVGYNLRNQQRRTMHTWVAPNFNFFLRQSLERQPKWGRGTLEVLSLVSCVQYVWSVA
jgi:hypothetical protein